MTLLSGLLPLLRLTAMIVVLCSPAQAVQPDEVLPDKALEARARSLSAGLRCLVCQNQSIDDSDAPLARDLRLVVRERLLAGDSDADVRSYLVSRYGDFVLLRPPFKASTLLLWLTPVIVLAAGGGAIILARRGRRAVPDGLSMAERERIDAILKGARQEPDQS